MKLQLLLSSIGGQHDPAHLPALQFQVLRDDLLDLQASVAGRAVMSWEGADTVLSIFTVLLVLAFYFGWYARGVYEREIEEGAEAGVRGRMK